MIVLNQIFDAAFLIFIAKLCLAMMLGIILGLERVYAHKTAGMRTYAIVTMAAALFVLVAQTVVAGFPITVTSADSLIRMASQIVVGVGFLGTGLIIFHDGHVENLTTAGGLWACAGIGIAVGFGMYREAIAATILTFFVLGILTMVERSIRHHYMEQPWVEPEPVQKKPRKRTKKTVSE